MFQAPAAAVTRMRACNNRHTHRLPMSPAPPGLLSKVSASAAGRTLAEMDKNGDGVVVRSCRHCLAGQGVIA